MANSQTPNVDWEDLFSKVASAVEEAALEKFGDYVVSMLLKQLLQVHSEELELLQSIQQDIKDLIAGPYHAGIIWLQEAEKKHRTSEERLSFITRARDKFIDALGQEREPFRKALIQYQTGICWLMLGKQVDAKEWLEASYLSATEALVKLRASI